MILTFGFILLPKLYYILTYSKTVGIVTGYRKEINKGRVRYAPIVVFEAPDKQQVRIATYSHIHDALKLHSRVEVIYNPAHPEKAYINNFYGLWSTTAIFLFPFVLLCTVCVFSADLLPKELKVFR